MGIGNGCTSFSAAAAAAAADVWTAIPGVLRSESNISSRVASVATSVSMSLVADVAEVADVAGVVVVDEAVEDMSTVVCVCGRM